MTSNNGKEPTGMQMESLAWAIHEFGDRMREFGRLEERAYHLKDYPEHFRNAKEDVERHAALIAKAKEKVTKAKTRTGATLVEWDNAEARNFFSQVDTDTFCCPQRENEKDEPGSE